MSNIKIISVPSFSPSATLFGDNEIIINNIDGKLYVKNIQNNTLRVINQDSDKNTFLDGDVLINKKIEFKETKDSDSILFISSSGKQSRIGVGTTTPESTIDFKSVDDSTIGTELILRTARSATTGAFSGDEGGSINFTIDSGSFNNLKTSGSLAKIKTKVTSVGTGGTEGKLVFELSKGAGPEGNDVFSYGFNQISGFNLYSQIQSASLLIKDFTPTGYSKFEMRDSSDNTKLSILKGNITASGDISSSGDIIGNINGGTF